MLLLALISLAKEIALGFASPLAPLLFLYPGNSNNLPVPGETGSLPSPLVCSTQPEPFLCEDLSGLEKTHVKINYVQAIH